MSVFLLLLLLGLAPGLAQALECSIAAVPGALARVEHDADRWLAAAPPALREALEGAGYAFPARGLSAARFEPLCSAVTPAVVVFDRPPERVFELIIQTERHGEFLSELGGTVPVSRAPGDHVDRHEVEILFTTITYHVRHQWDASRGRIWWDLSPGHANDLGGIVGYWELYPLRGGRTLGFYGTAVDVGPVIPKRLQDSLTRRNVRGMVAAIRDWVDREAGIASASGRTSAKAGGQAR